MVRFLRAGCCHWRWIQRYGTKGTWPNLTTLDSLTRSVGNWITSRAFCAFMNNQKLTFRSFKVAIPGAFKATDPGYTVNIYNGVSLIFKYPKLKSAKPILVHVIHYSWTVSCYLLGSHEQCQKPGRWQACACIKEKPTPSGNRSRHQRRVKMLGWNMGCLMDINFGLLK